MTILAELEEEIDLSGHLRLWHDDHVLIVYEQKMDNCNFLPIRQHGLFKFTFNLGHLRPPSEVKSTVTYEEFLAEVQDYLSKGFQVYSDEDEVDDIAPKSWYVAKLLDTEKKSLRKYQFRF